MRLFDADDVVFEEPMKSYFGTSSQVDQLYKQLHVDESTKVPIF
jgi:hypothetical protein